VPLAQVVVGVASRVAVLVLEGLGATVERQFKPSIDRPEYHEWTTLSHE
jgi:hypothetical protein